MAQATWTVEAGSDSGNSRRGAARIALPALDTDAWDCLTWSVELVLPLGATLSSDDAATVRADLAASASAEFEFDLAGQIHSNEVRDERGWFVVRVRNPDADPGIVLHRDGGSPLWLYPVNFQFGD